MPPMVMPPTLACDTAVPDDGAQRNRGDDLHGGQEEGAQPGGAVAGAVHFAGQLAELAQIFRLRGPGL